MDEGPRRYTWKSSDVSYNAAKNKDSMMGRKVKFNMSNVVSDGWCRLQAAGSPRCHREKV